MKLKSLFLIIPFYFLSSCTKETFNKDLELEKDSNTQTNNKLGPIPDKVYVAGTNGFNVPAQWINGTQTLLSNPTPTGDAKSIFKDASGNIYVAGTSGGKPVYWKNNVMNILTYTDGIYGEANSIFVNGTDIYVVGAVNIYISGQPYQFATIWKNGVPTKIGDDQSTAKSVFVYGSDVYVCGDIDVNGRKPVIWKNNIMTYLNTSATYNCFANDIEVVNGDVYVCGYGRKKYINGTDPEELHNKARYWKNGVETKLSDDNSRSNFAYSICVNNNNIYVAGADVIQNVSNNGTGPNVDRAKYWKNNVPVYLTDGVSTRAQALSISVKNDFTVYTSGWSAYSTSLSRSEAVIWKNTSMSNLTVFSTGLSTANSIYVE